MIATMTDDTKAVLLLCGYLNKDGTDKPLSLAEYSRVVHWLVQSHLRPADLLQEVDFESIAVTTQIDSERLAGLLKRGVALAFAVEEWERNGIWVISRSDADYPEKLKRHLKGSAPPVLYGTGEIHLWNRPGLGMVGSRNVDSAGETFARHVAERCAQDGMAVVSGGARGVDQISMSAAAEAGGIAIGALAENLLKKSVEREARELIADGRLVLLSPYHPKASFSVGNAMGRNKLIYGLADYTLVVSTDYKKGGTWAGAEEELKRPNRRPVFVRIDPECPAANRRLLEIGAIDWPIDMPTESLIETLAELASNSGEQIKSSRLSEKALFDVSEGHEEYSKNDGRVSESSVELEMPSVSENPTMPPEISDQLYQAVLPFIIDCAQTPTTAADLSQRLDVVPAQIKKWLERAVTDGILEKKQKPVRYVMRNANEDRSRKTLFPDQDED
jgi:predicted Rossmann fold nucleotide-binding protein DprA/Smf involved in DNA uptake